METTIQPPKRLDSVDLLRGVIMILMAVDHVRYPYFSNIAIQPENVNMTYMSLFLTRWITHFVAPVFFLLAGTGAYLMTKRGKPIARVSRYLWTRGLWLVVLELSIVEFAWSFMPGWGFAGVIWSLGWSMVILALLIRLPLPAVAVIGAATMIFHHALDGITPASLGGFGWLWNFLHAGGHFEAEWLPAKFFPVLYTIIPGFGVMAGGFALGVVLQLPEEQRRKVLLLLGLSMTILFVVLRGTNFYGSPPTPNFPPQMPPQYRFSNEFVPQETMEKTIISFLNTQKYPFSFQFLLMTLGPALVLLSWFDRFTFTSGPGKWLGAKIVVYGRVPFFYYVLHLLTIHLLAITVALASGLSTDWLFGKALPFDRQAPPEFGYGLAGTYFITLIVVVLLYFPCKWFAGFKQTHSYWWQSYI